MLWFVVSCKLSISPFEEICSTAVTTAPHKCGGRHQASDLDTIFGASAVGVPLEASFVHGIANRGTFGSSKNRRVA